MKRIDQHKMFPYIAWGLFISFAFFTYNLAQRVEKLEASEKTQRTEAAVENIDHYFTDE